MKTFFLFSIILIASSVYAGPLSNFYLEGFGGLNLVNSYEKHGIRVDYNSGYAVGGSLGYRFSSFFRLEGEGAYRSNGLDKITVDDIELSVTGHLNKATAMANGIIEIPLFESPLVPYIGGGAGKRWDKESFTLQPILVDGIPYNFSKVIKSHDFVAQGILGLIFSSGQKMQAGVEYRYLDGPDMQGNHTLDLKLKKYF